MRFLGPVRTMVLSCPTSPNQIPTGLDSCIRFGRPFWNTSAHAWSLPGCNCAQQTRQCGCVPAFNAIAELATDLRDIASKFVDPAWSGGRRERIPVNWLHHNIVLLEIVAKMNKMIQSRRKLNQNNIVRNKAGVTDIIMLEE